MCLILVPDGLAVRWSLDVEQHAQYQDEKPGGQGQESERDDCSFVVLLASSERIHLDEA